MVGKHLELTLPLEDEVAFNYTLECSCFESYSAQEGGKG